ncbi:hypothetical protein ACFQO1_02165 [Jejudonia soesokkakensis]|uniref:SIR2-like domain-containing protein n=1 Tax=Jejudonia soesokkakensis TaxID=1323432 RepID=A0ABW2MT68_9FLAO
MEEEFSKYSKSSSKPKISYLLGAGASYNSVPIWKQQGSTIFQIASKILAMIKEGYSKSYDSIDEYNIEGSTYLVKFFEKMKFFGEKALEFGSIDIYARKLWLLENKSELNELKAAVSVYLDLWENFYYKDFKIGKSDGNYSRLDNRYLSLLSILLEKENISYPKLSDDINFFSWNYDLQLETAFSKFCCKPINNLIELNSIIPYSNLLKNDINENQSIFHLNGHRGIFKFDKDYVETVQHNNLKNWRSYLGQLKSNLEVSRRFNNDFSNSINYSWEMKKTQRDLLKAKFGDTDVLIIIGYSFPAFNRALDSELFGSLNLNNLEVVFQSPSANKSIIKTLNPNIKENNIKILNSVEDLSSFYIPSSFLYNYKEPIYI